MTKRYALYYAPPEDEPLTRLAASWLGRDVFDAAYQPPEPPRNGFTYETWLSATSSPRLYGFHATLKPPFRLAPGSTEVDLLEKVRAFAQRRKRFTAPALVVSSLSSFLALTLSEPSLAFEALAAECVQEFDQFRAQPPEEELAQRRRRLVKTRHLDYLEKWGYPYVMDEWRFHMTLTSSLAPPLFESIGTHLRHLFAPHSGTAFVVDSICVFVQPDVGQPFHAAERFHLS
jgi:putative phosphonate metabolism protein